jgi:hypothetical protein
MQTDKHTADGYTEKSFTFRRMKPWQIGVLLIVAAALVVLAFMW